MMTHSESNAFATSDIVQLHIWRQHNSSILVYTTPSEIWRNIFLELFLEVSVKSILQLKAEDEPDGDDFLNYGEISADWSWVSVMLVCQRFREIVVNYPRLWSIIVIHTEKSTLWGKLCLNRAHTYPLTLVLMVQDSMREVLLPLTNGIDGVRQWDILKLLENCETLLMKGPDLFSMWSGLNDALPRLRYLSLSSLNYDEVM
jgi:hypothetical protein